MYSIRTERIFDTVHVQQNIFEKTLIKVGSPHLYASFGTFIAQIGLITRGTGNL